MDMHHDDVSREDDALIDAVERFLAGEVRPVAIALEQADEYPEAIVEQMREMGLFGAIIPEAYGGLGLSVQTYARLIETIAAEWMSLSGVINSHLIMASAVLLLSYMVSSLGCCQVVGSRVRCAGGGPRWDARPVSSPR